MGRGSSDHTPSEAQILAELNRQGLGADPNRNGPGTNVVRKLHQHAVNRPPRHQEVASEEPWNKVLCLGASPDEVQDIIITYFGGKTRPSNWVCVLPCSREHLPPWSVLTHALSPRPTHSRHHPDWHASKPCKCSTTAGWMKQGIRYDIVPALWFRARSLLVGGAGVRPLRPTCSQQTASLEDTPRYYTKPQISRCPLCNHSTLYCGTGAQRTAFGPKV